MQIEIKYGIILGTGFAVWTILEFLTGFHGPYIQYRLIISNISIFIYILGLVYGIREKKNNEPAGELSFGQGVKSGLYMVVYSLPMAIAGLVVYTRAINPDFIPAVVDFLTQKLIARGVSQEDALLLAKANFNLRIFIQQSFIGIIWKGSVVAVVVSFILRTRSGKTQSE